ncbi:MAG: hypothetical protein QW480_02605 [Candidatus Aenigmatarchaeota archaeon]
MKVLDLLKKIRIRKKDELKEFQKEFEIEEEKKGFIGFFENACRFAEGIIRITPPNANSLKNALFNADINASPEGVFSLTILSILGTFIFMLLIAFIIPTIGIFLMIIPLAVGYLIYTYPPYAATVTKIRACDETVKVILYMVIYLRLTPQMEGAFNFASKHCTGPLGNDLKEMLWGLRIGKYKTLEEAISSKLDKWLAWDKEFIESINLLFSLEHEYTEQRRKNILDKALTHILNSTYDKMQVYARELRIPMTFVHAMGITFPLMGLVMFPMISIFLHGEIGGYLSTYLAFGYIFVLPLILYFYLRRIVSKRPGAFSFPDVSHHPELPPPGKFSIKIGNRKIFISALLVAIAFFVIISIPALNHYAKLISDYLFISLGANSEAAWKDYMIKMYEKSNIFPYTLQALTLIVGLTIAISAYCLGRSYQRLKIRNEIKELENSFQVALFDLSEILSSGVPIEFAIQELLEKYERSKLEATPMYKFFSGVLTNMKKLGMTLRTAIFDNDYGVIKWFPSILMKDVLEILLSASGKSSSILAMASFSISSFLEKMKKVEDSIIEMLSEISASLKMQASFIAPFICGVVAAMATDIIVLLQEIVKMINRVEEQFMAGLFSSQTKSLSDMLNFVKIEKVMPLTLFQLIVGIYMIEIVIIICYFLNGISNGFDSTTRNVLIGKSLIIALIIYSFVLIIGILITKGLVLGFSGT